MPPRTIFSRLRQIAPCLFAMVYVNFSILNEYSFSQAAAGARGAQTKPVRHEWRCRWEYRVCGRSRRMLAHDPRTALIFLNYGARKCD
jgi:hypothetical protein